MFLRSLQRTNLLTHIKRRKSKQKHVRYPFPHLYLKLFQMIKTWLINMKWVLLLDKVRTGADATVSKRPGQEVRFHCLRVVTCLLHSPQLKDRRNLKKVSLAKRPERRSRVYRSKARRNIVKIISPSYITSFLQQNRSIAMITILLNVNIQYLLHFQINWFLIYFTLFPKKK